MSSLEPTQAEKAANAIKYLKTVNAKLQNDLQESIKCKEKAITEYSRLKRRYDEHMKQSSTLTSRHTYPNNTSNTTDANQQTPQNIEQQQRLKAFHTDLLKEKDATIQHLRNIITAKDEEITYYKRNSGESEAAAQGSEVKMVLQKVFSLNRTYAAHMSALERQAYSVKFSTNQETVQAQAASADDDLNGNATMSPHTSNSFDTQLENHKAEYEELNRRLQDALQQQKETQMKLDQSLAHVMKLEDEKERLIKEKNLYMKHNCENILAAQRVFQDDFECERNEKIQTHKENQELKGQNEKLKDACEKLQEKLRDLQSTWLDNERAQPATYPIMPQHSLLEPADLTERHHGCPSSTWYPERTPTTHHHQEFLSMENQGVIRQSSVSVHPQVHHPLEQTRRIGFQSSVPSEHLPTGADYNSQPHTPRHPSNAQMQPHLQYLRSVQADNTVDEEMEDKPTKTADGDK